MNKKRFFTLVCAWLTTFTLLSAPATPKKPLEEPKVPIVIPPPPPPKEVEPDCVGVQVPIPKDCRIYNKSGSQCVWCSIECLARYWKVEELYDLTKHYTWATGPSEVQHILSTKYPKVKWKQVQNHSDLVPFIKKYVTEKKFGVGLGIPGHMLNLVHYDEEAGIVKVIDNCGPKALQVQDWSMDKFKRLADGWVLVIFPHDYVETPEDAFDCTLTEPNKIYGIP